MKLKIRALLLAAMFVVSLLPAMSFADSNVAEFDGTGYTTLQEALTAAYTTGGDVTVTLLADVTQDVSIREKNNHKLTLDGAGKKLTGQINIVGNSAYETNSATVIKNLTIDVSGATDGGIYVDSKRYESGDEASNNYGRYTQNVTIQDCKFTNSGSSPRTIEAIAQATGGCKDWKITNCTVDNTMHSLIQATNFKSLEISGCTINSKNGLNLVSSESVTVTDCNIDVDGYAVRVGTNGSGETDMQVALVDCSVKTSGTEGDAAIVIRSGATAAKLEMESCTVEAGEGMPAISNTAGSGVTVTLEDCQGIGEEGENGEWGTVEIPAPAYAGPVMNWVKVNAADNGVVKSGPLAASAGATVTLYPKAAEGYVLDTVSVLDAEGNAVALDGLKFAIPAGGVTVSATFKLAE